MKRSIEQISVDVLKCAVGWEPEAKLIGNVSALEVARLAIPNIDSCPKCGATAWVNIDCDLCMMVGVIQNAEEMQ